MIIESDSNSTVAPNDRPGVVRLKTGWDEMTGLDGWEYGTAFIGGDKTNPGIAGRELFLLRSFGLHIVAVRTDDGGTAISKTLTLLWFS